MTRVALLAVCAVLSCDRGADRVLPAPAVEAAIGPSLLEAEPLARGMSALRASAGTPVRALELAILRDRIVLQAQHPGDRGRVVQYEYAGSTTAGPTPVELRGAGELEQNLFALDEVAVDRIPALAQVAVSRIDSADGEVTRVIVRRALPAAERVEIRLFVKSPRRDGYLDADASGKPLENE
jgi:hypothetical protein